MNRPIPPEHFERLVQRHHGAVYRTAYGILRRDDLARDVSQVVFLRLLEGREQIDRAQDEGRLLCWIAAKQALMHQRSSTTRREREGNLAMERDRQASTDGEAQAEQREMLVALPKLVDALPEALRNAIVLRFQEQRSFAEIGELSEVAESTAHERVRRGLEQLRAEMGRLGFAGGLPTLEGALERLAPRAVPPKLQMELLALAQPAAATAAGLTGGVASSGLFGFLAVAACALLAVVAALWQSQGVGASRSIDEVGRVEPEAATTANAVGSLPPPASFDARAPASAPPRAPATLADLRVGLTGGIPPPPAPNARRLEVAGRLVDADGRGVGGVDVKAVPAGAKGDWDLIVETARSAADGSFRWEGALHGEVGAAHTFIARHADFLETRVNFLPPANGVAALGDLALRRNSDDADGEFTLRVQLRDPDGRAVDGAIARLFRSVRVDDRDSGASSNVERMEAFGKSSADGGIELRGTKLGAKRLVVDARAAGLRCDPRELRIDSSGALDVSIELEAGLAIAGILRGPDGGPPPRLYVFTMARDDEGAERAASASAIEDNSAEFTPDGRFVFRGLDPGRYRLRGAAVGCSPFEIHGVEAGDETLDLMQKRIDDPREVGVHRGEIHGTLVDALTQEPVALDLDRVELRRIQTDDPAQIARDELPNEVAGSLAQTFQMDEPPPPSAEFHIGDLDAGRYVVRVASPQHGVNFSAPIEITRGEIRRDLRIELVVSAKLIVEVERPRGVDRARVGAILTGSGPLSQARIDALDAPLQDPARDDVYARVTRRSLDDHDRIEFGVPAHLPVRAVVAAQGCSPVSSETMSLSPGEVRRVTLRLAPRR